MIMMACSCHQPCLQVSCWRVHDYCLGPSLSSFSSSVTVVIHWRCLLTCCPPQLVSETAKSSDGVAHLNADSFCWSEDGVALGIGSLAISQPPGISVCSGTTWRQRTNKWAQCTRQDDYKLISRQWKKSIFRYFVSEKEWRTNEESNWTTYLSCMCVCMCVSVYEFSCVCML